MKLLVQLLRFVILVLGLIVGGFHLLPMLWRDAGRYPIFGKGWL